MSNSLPLEFFRQEQFANEIAEKLSDKEIDMLINWGVEAINQAYEIKEENLYAEYEVSQKQIEYDIKAFDHNIVQLQKALSIKQGFEIIETPMSKMRFGLFCN